jgi:hypothetical protein
MARRPSFRPSLAEVKRQNQAALDWIRASSYREDAPRIDVGAKEKRAAPTRRATVSEAEVQRAIRQLLRVHPLVAWHGRINRGAVQDSAGNYVAFNDIKGCSDLIGMMKTGHWLAIEVKRPGNVPTEDQQEFLDAVACNGGLAFWADSVETVERRLREWATR